MRGSVNDRNIALSRFLLQHNQLCYHGCAPSELLMGRQLCALFTLLKPTSLQADVDKSQDRSYVEGTKSKSREFNVGDSGKVRNMIGRDKWLFGTAVKQVGPLKYLVKIDSRVCYCHLDHLVSAGTQTEDIDYDRNHPRFFNAVKPNETISQSNISPPTTSLPRSSEADSYAAESNTTPTKSTVSLPTTPELSAMPSPTKSSLPRRTT